MKYGTKYYIISLVSSEWALNTTGGSVGREIEKVCTDNELVITTWSPIHLRTKVKELYWKGGEPAAAAMAFWQDTLRYLHLACVKDRDMLAKAIQNGVASRDLFGTAYCQHDRKFDGFQLGTGNAQLDDTLLLIEPGAARAYEEKMRPGPAPAPESGLPSPTPPGPEPPVPSPRWVRPLPKAFHATVEVEPATVKMRLVQIADEIVSVLGWDPSASVKVVVEMSAEFPAGAKDTVKRACRRTRGAWASRARIRSDASQQ